MADKMRVTPLIGAALQEGNLRRDALTEHKEQRSGSLTLVRV